MAKNVKLVLYYKALALKLWFGTEREFTDQGNVQVPVLSTFLCYCVFHGNSIVLSCSDPFSTTESSG